jgi:hypothetical protein
MREQEVRELYEAYLQVHQPQEEVEHLDENVQDAVKGALEKGANFMKTNPVGKAVSKIESFCESLLPSLVWKKNSNSNKWWIS